MKRAEVEKVFTFSGHRDCIYALEVSTVPTHFFSASGDGMVVRWDLEKPDEGELFANVPNSVYALAMSPKTNQLLVGQNFSGVHVIDLETKLEIRNIILTKAAIFDIKICLDQVWIGDGDGSLFVLNLSDFSLLHQSRLSEKSVRAIAFNPFENEVAVAYSDFHIRIFDLETFVLKNEILAHTNSVFSVVFSPDGRHLLSSGRDAHIKIWDVYENYKMVKDIPAHMFAVNHLTFSPDGNYFASSSMDKSVKIWDAKTFDLIKVIDKARHAGHGTSVNKSLWIGYHNYLISGGDDRNLGIWELEFYEKSILS